MRKFHLKILKTKTNWWIFTIALSFFVVGCGKNDNSDDQSLAVPYIFNNEGAFQKIERSYWNKNMHLDVVSASNQFARGNAVDKRARPHMVPDWKHNQSALYEGEYFVMNISAAMFGEKEAKYMDLYIISNFELIPFFFQKVDSAQDFLSLEDIEAMYENETAQKKAELVMENGIPVFLTFAIPPNSFPKAGAYDIRIVARPRGVNSRTFPIRPVLINYSHILFYGGDQFPPLPRKIENASGVEIFTELIRRISNGLVTNVLALTIRDFPEDGDHPVNELTDMSQGSDVYAIFRIDPFVEKREPAVLSVLVNDELTVLGSIELDADPPSGRPNLYRVSHALTEVGDAAVSFVMMHKPLMDQSKIREQQRVVEVSNTLNVRVVPACVFG